jgi:hypothetical protein
MTEDDTFNALKRSPHKVVHNELMAQGACDNDLSLLKRHGWTYDELFDELIKQHNARSLYF